MTALPENEKNYITIGLALLGIESNINYMTPPRTVRGCTQISSLKIMIQIKNKEFSAAYRLIN